MFRIILRNLAVSWSLSHWVRGCLVFGSPVAVIPPQSFLGRTGVRLLHQLLVSPSCIRCSTVESIFSVGQVMSLHQPAPWRSGLGGAWTLPSVVLKVTYHQDNFERVWKAQVLWPHSELLGCFHALFLDLWLGSLPAQACLLFSDLFLCLWLLIFSVSPTSHWPFWFRHPWLNPLFLPL